MELDFILSPSELPAYFLAVKYVFAVLFGLWLLVWFRWGAPWILVGGAIFFCLFAWTAMQAPLHRLYSFQPPLDRTSSCAKTRPFRNRPQISSLDALGIRAESRVFRAAGLTSDPWAGG